MVRPSPLGLNTKYEQMIAHEHTTRPLDLFGCSCSLLLLLFLHLFPSDNSETESTIRLPKNCSNKRYYTLGWTTMEGKKIHEFQ